MSEEHKMTKKDKLVLGATLAAIFLGVFVLGFVGLILIYLVKVLHSNIILRFLNHFQPYL